MKKRVAIARAIVLNPKYLFCDEPNSGLDPYTAILIDNLLQELTHEYGMTTVINTHDMNSLVQIGERILFIKDGEMAWSGVNLKSLNLIIKIYKILSFHLNYTKQLGKQDSKLNVFKKGPSGAF